MSRHPNKQRKPMLPVLMYHGLHADPVSYTHLDVYKRQMTSLAMAHDRRQDMGRMGRSRIEREFSLQAMVHSFDQTYQLLLQDAGMRACAVMP